MKKCAYCGEILGSPFHSKTDEHIIPDSLLKLYPEQDISIHNTSRFVDNRGMTISDVCSSCNNGFLSKLDSYGKQLIESYFYIPYKFSDYYIPFDITINFNLYTRRNEMKKKILYSICVSVLAVALTACGASASSDNASEDSSPKIDSFRDYEWGTSFEDVRGVEVTSDMKELLDYQEQDVDGMTGLTIKNGNVAGYETEIGFAFDDTGLIAGGYDLDIDDDSFTEWVQKYTDEYGEPVLEKESIGWGACALWVDDSKNFIFLSGLTGISYGKADSPYLQFLNDGLYKYHEIDLEEEINKIGNTDGI